MMKRLRLSLALALGTCSAAVAAELPDYIRYAEDAASARLEVAIRSFTLPSGQKVDLVGAVHIADPSYYQELNRRFAAYDSVLFEMVGDPRRLAGTAPADVAKANSGGGAVTVIQQAASRYLDLTFQLEAIDYRGNNMVHADMSMEEFQSMQAQRGENMATLFVRAMQAQTSGALQASAMNELDTFGLLRILVSPDSAAAFKKALAKTFDQMESVTAAMEGEQGSTILGARNQVAIQKAKQVLADKSQRHIAVFYGGAHMPGIETALRTEMAAKATGEIWLAAWTMPKVKPAQAPQAGDD